MVVRCCDPSYDVGPLRKEGISVMVRLHTDSHSFSCCLLLCLMSHDTLIECLLSPSSPYSSLSLLLLSCCIPILPHFLLCLLFTSFPSFSSLTLSSVQSINRTSHSMTELPHPLSWCDGGWILWQRRSRKTQTTVSQSTVWLVLAGT